MAATPAAAHGMEDKTLSEEDFAPPPPKSEPATSRPVDEETRKLFAQNGIFQGEDGTFYKDSQQLKNKEGRPMTAEEVRATLPGASPNAPAEQVAAPSGTVGTEPPPMSRGEDK